MSVIEEIAKYLIENPDKRVIFSGITDINALRFEIREVKESVPYYVDSKYIPIKNFLETGDLDNVIRFWLDQMIKEIKTMNDSELKEVLFDKYCKTCKHYAHKFPNEDFSFEAQEPCATCLEAENAAREETERPVYWEKK